MEQQREYRWNRGGERNHNPPLMKQEPIGHRTHKSWQHSHDWHTKRRYIARRAFRYFSLIGLLVLIGMAIASALLTRLLGGNGHTAALVWITGCSLSVALPFLAMAIATRAYRSFATPLAKVMAAADAVADGDLTTRVPADAAGELGRLARSFNHMATELERNDQQRRNLTADVAHELRTPLHIIQGNLEGILDGVYEATPEHINATLDEAKALARLVEDLRTLSMAEAGELALVHEVVDIAELLEDIHTSFFGLAESEKIAFSLDVHEGPRGLLVSGDAGRLYQVLSNLVINALRHTAVAGTVNLRGYAGKQTVVVEVIDSGEGIAEEDLPYIFDRFWRGDRSRNHAAGAGGGLGLAIARQLVQAHEGTIAVNSVRGAGSTFHLEFPAHRGA